MGEKMRRNVRLLAWLKFGHMFMLAMAVIVPYWNDLGLDQQAIYQLQTVFLLTVVVFEVPSGYFADRFGRRTSLIWGHAMWALGWSGYVFADTWFEFAIAEVVLGLGVGFTSGADGSLRYDSLLFMGDEERNLRESSRAVSWGSLGEGVAGLIGAALALISLRSPIIAQAIVSVAMTPIVLALTEAPYEKRSQVHTPWREIWHITKFTLHDNRALKWLVMYAASLSTMTYTAVWLMQPYYLEVGVGIAWFGALWFIKHLALAFFSHRAEAIRDRFGLRSLLIWLPIVGVATYLIIGASYTIWVLPIWIGFELLRGVQVPVMIDQMHQQTTSHIRATVMSVNGLVLRSFFAVFALLMGWVSGTWGIQATLLASAGIYGALTAVIFRGLDRNHTLSPKR